MSAHIITVNERGISADTEKKQHHPCKLKRGIHHSEEDSKDTVIGGESFLQLVQMHQQHWVDYVHLSAEEGLPLTLGEDWAAPLVTEVQFLLSRFSIFCGHPSFPYSNSYSASSLYSFFQVL